MDQEDALSPCIGESVLENKVTDVIGSLQYQITLETSIYGIFLQKCRAVAIDMHPIPQSFDDVVHEEMRVGPILHPDPKSIVIG